MELGELSARYPKLWHMAEAGSWPGIREHGLLSTTALLDLYGVEGEERHRIESRSRPEIVPLDHRELGTSLVRDNKPLQETVLRRCIQGMEHEQWYETLNRRVFFWVTRDRLLKLLGARPYKDRPHLVLEVDTASLLERHAESVTLSPINSGATFAMNPAPRGPNTFQRIANYPTDRPVVELAVDYSVPDIEDLVLSASRWEGQRGTP